MTTATDNAARQVLDAWADLTANDFAQLTSDNGMEVDGCAVWVRSNDNKIVAFRQLEDGPEEWTEIPAPATTSTMTHPNDIITVKITTRQMFRKMVVDLKKIGAKFDPDTKTWEVRRGDVQWAIDIGRVEEV